ncbi:PadR family transcriptional regulator [Phytohabitans flavus]|uniref:PadR family transcriptional regulator n=1 Tax=Phytohabitans flavus TaxID=1076124 RepID=UPI001E329B59|nr:PadR family transcriptional regulator [Phytohabitans flavus]
MSIRHGLLALLERGPMYGYQLRAAFEESTGTTWPLNIGQVYTTLSRLERDGLIRPLPENDGGSGRTRSLIRAGASWPSGSPPRSAVPTGPATSWRSSSRWRSPRPASTYAR